VKSFGHTVVGIAITADEAIAMAGKDKPDPVLMDVWLVVNKDGITAAREIQTRYGIRLIFVTATRSLPRLNRRTPLSLAKLALVPGDG
jgi:two-component system, response regulator PdtaR